MDSQFIVGIDLGTTNSALAYGESAASERAHIEIDTIPQLINPNEIADRTLLPSFLYIPGDLDFPKGSLGLPWDAEPKFVIGELARKRGAESPGPSECRLASMVSAGGFFALSAVPPDNMGRASCGGRERPRLGRTRRSAHRAGFV